MELGNRKTVELVNLMPVLEKKSIQINQCDQYNIKSKHKMRSEKKGVK